MGKNTYKHNKQGKLLEESIYKPNDSLITKNVYKLDVKGNAFETMVYDSTNRLVRIWRSRDDRMNNLTSSAQFSPENKQVSNDTHSYTYYANGKIKTDTYYEDGNIDYKQALDIHGNITEDIMYSGDANKDIMSKETDIYKFDTKGNWIEKVDYENGNVFQTMDRVIKY